MTRWTSPSRGLLFGALAVVFATSALVSGCDSPSTIGDPDPVDAVSGYDAAVVARAAALAADDDPSVRVPFTLAATDAPLLRFDDSDQFDEMATALEAIARATGEPLAIHSDLAPYTGAEYDLSVQKGGLALTDRLGRVVIGDQMFTVERSARGLETVVTDIESGKLVERYALRSFESDGQIDTPQGEFAIEHDELTDVYKITYSGAPDEARINSWDEDAWISIGNNAIANKQGQQKVVWSIYAHSAYRTTGGAKKANAQSEFRWSDFVFLGGDVELYFDSNTQEANTSDFDVKVDGRVRTEHYGCKTYYGVSPTYSPARIYMNAGGSRGTGQAVYYSEHTTRFISTGAIIHSKTGSNRLDGEDNDSDCQYGT